MTPLLEWPGFRLDYAEGVLSVGLPATADLEVKAERCVEVSLRPRPEGSSGQLLFCFRSAPPEAADLIAVRVVVPAVHFRDVEQLIQRLRRDHGVPDRQADEDGTAELARVPPGTDGWVLAPTGSASEKLFDEVMVRVESDAD
ncbi:hypothetical protein QNO07_04230 [Streptomyces sp. 549]|uniref:hypothetical protein n=1 Tax=Streptomyces sp. 549 TaxID=3049076 RepID=UPI0024C3273E|nr:hypothetical protein [Streptomyces sp. 549]MDK1472639.1 hypothetical protein [Streptomyces sp. 549]